VVDLLANVTANKMTFRQNKLECLSLTAFNGLLFAMQVGSVNHKIKAWQKIIASDKRSSLFFRIVNDAENTLYCFGSCLSKDNKFWAPRHSAQRHPAV
jgi:hypothetical protein